MCVLCAGNCKTCISSSTQCLTCYSGYIISGTICQKCEANCTSCLSVDTCLICQDGYYYDTTTNQCKICYSDCKTCNVVSGTYSCLTCFNQFILVTGTCIQYMTGCQVSSSALTCTTCFPEFYKDTSSICNPCPIGCASCSSSLFCNTCQQGYYKDMSNLCIACSSNCKICNAVNCTTCEDRYYNNGGLCSLCSSNCATCSSEFYCLTCNNSYSLNSSHICVSVCNSICYYSGCYILLGYCYACSDPSCQYCNDVTGICTQALQGFSLDLLNQCFKCNVFHCEKCGVDQVCSRCESGYYLNLTLNKCTTACSANQLSTDLGCFNCPAGCMTCTTSTYCTQCFSDSFYLLSISLTQRQCVPCIFPCIRCFLSSYCYECATGFYLNGSYTCQYVKLPCLQSLDSNECSLCDNQFFLDTFYNPSICSVCSSMCLLCTSNSNCTKCRDGFYLSTGSCIKCPFNCVTCSNQNTCLTCTATRNSPPLCQCLPHYYEINSTDCLICDDTCETCLYQSTICFSCYVSQARILQGILCLCDVGYFNVGVNCEQCHPKCRYCLGSSEDQCISCRSPLIFNPLYQTCECPIGKYLVITGIIYNCNNCFTGCAVCTSSSTCESCYDNMKLLLGTSCVCKDGYAWDPATSSCQLCNIKFCSDCQSGITTCSSCFFGSVSPSNTCSCSPSSLQFDSFGISCTLCHFSCLTCDGFDYDNCLSCNPDRIYDPTSKTCACNQGKFENQATQSCETCHYSCDQCVGSLINECTSCSVLNFRQPDSTISIFKCVCQDSYYDEENQNQCLKCDPNCQTCEGNPYYCLSCDILQLKVISKEHSCLCESNYYYDNISFACEKCHQSCLECINGNSNGCLSCQPNSHRIKQEISAISVSYYCSCDAFYYDNGVSICEKCDHSCYSCGGPLNTQCKTCSLIPSDYRYYNELNAVTQLGQCLCKDGYRDNSVNQECAKCYFTCETCDATKACTSCPPSRLLTSGACDCIDGLFEFGNHECQNCSLLCYTCKNDVNSCFSCDTVNNFRELNKFSRCVCKDGYFDEGVYDQLTNVPIIIVPVCTKCENHCKTCKSNLPNSCLSCFLNLYFVLNSEKQCVCALGYELQNSECIGVQNLKNSFYDTNDLIKMKELIQRLLSILKYVSLAHLIFNQPMQSNGGFQVHQVLLLHLFANTKMNEIAITGLNPISDYDPYFVFTLKQLVSYNENKQDIIAHYLNDKLEYLEVSSNILQNCSGYIVSFFSIIGIYFLLRLTIFRKEVLFPKEIYLRLQWRYKLYLIQKEHVFPFILIICSFLLNRIFYFALIDLFSTYYLLSFHSVFAIFIVLFQLSVLGFCFYVICFSNTRMAKMKYYLCYEMKEGQGFYLFFQYLVEILINFLHVYYNTDTQYQTIVPLLGYASLSIYVTVYRPYRLWWENILQLTLCVIIVVTFFQAQLTSQLSLQRVMEKEGWEVYNESSFLYLTVMIALIWASIIIIFLRILKGIVRVCIIIYGLICHQDSNNYLWSSLTELQEYDKRELLKEFHAQMSNTSMRLIDRKILQEFMITYQNISFKKEERDDSRSTQENKAPDENSKFEIEENSFISSQSNE